MVASALVPIPSKGFWEYRWMGSYLGTAFIDRLFEGYREDELKIAHMNMHCIVSSLTKDRPGLANDKRLGGGRGQRQHRSLDEGHAAPIL